jgi:hypothetical protein
MTKTTTAAPYTGGYYTTGEMASAAHTTIKTINTWHDAGLIDADVDALTGRRRIHADAMRKVEACKAWYAKALDTNAPPAAVIGAFLRWSKAYPVAAERPGLAPFLAGAVLMQGGPGVYCSVRTPSVPLDGVL